jgi:hypothetical protein
VIEVHDDATQGGTTTFHVPLGEQVALGPHWPGAAYEQLSVQHASHALPSAGISAGHTHAGGNGTCHCPLVHVAVEPHSAPP